MQPYYSDSLVTIYHGDCREMLCHLSRNASVVTDPPYGIGLRNNDVDGHRRSGAFDIAGDATGAVGQSVIDWASGLDTIAFSSPWQPWPGHWRNLIAWDKGGAVGGGGDPTTCLKRSWELIQVNNRGPLRRGRQESVWRFPMTPNDMAQHIAAKPVALMSALLRSFCDPSTCVIDPFAGSGSTLVAAKLLGRHAIGIEIEERYCEIAAERCRQEVLALGVA